VPKDLKLSGEQEAFTVAVTYDTQALYGKVEASWKLTLKAE
jgi:hypothetical protein